MSTNKEITTLGEIIKKILYILFSFDTMKESEKLQSGGNQITDSVNLNIKTGDVVINEFLELAKKIFYGFVRKMKAIAILFVYASMYPVIPLYAVMSATFSFLLYVISNLRIV